MDNDETLQDHQPPKAATTKSRRLGAQGSQFSQKRLQETEAREFWNRRALKPQEPDRKAA